MHLVKLQNYLNKKLLEIYVICNSRDIIFLKNKISN